METFLSFTVIGIVAGAIYAVTAMGLVVTYTTTGVFNFAQGAVGMVAAFSYWELTQSYHWPVVLALVVVLLVEAPLLGALVEFIFMRRIYGASADRSLMVTLGVLLIMVGVATAVWGQQTLRIVPPFFEGHEVTIFGVVVTYQQLLIVIVAVVIALGLRLYFMNFRSGVAMRAVVDDPELLALAGVAPYRVSRRGWMLGFMLAGLAGVLLAPTVGSTGLNIDTLTLLVVNGYAAAVVGRLRSLPWTFGGGIALGLADAYATGYLPGHIPAALVEQIATIIPAVFLFVALLVVPSARLRAIGRIPVHLPPKVANARQSLVGSGLLVVAVAVISVVAAGSTLATISQGIALGIVALSLVLLTGYGGQVSLCQYTFLGVGAFTMGKVAGGGGSWLGLLAAVGICAALGMLVALPALRLRGLYLALATLAFGEAMYYGFFSNSSIFPGYGGSITVGRLALPGTQGIGARTEMIEIAVFFGACAIGVLALRRSAFGRRLVAMNDSPAAFATLGIDATVTKMIAFGVSAGMAGLGGVLYAGVQGSISANDVELFASLILLLFVSIWGIRTTAGALLAGLTATILPSLSTHLPPAWAQLSGLVAGLGIVLLGRSPEGVLGVPWLRARVRLPLGDRDALEPSGAFGQTSEGPVGVLS